MSSEIATSNAGELSLRKNARIAGIIYLGLAVFSAFSMIYVSPKLFVPGDAAATAGNILASEGLYRLGFVSNLFGQVCFLFLGVSLYKLLRPVNTSRARLMIVLVVASVPIAFLNMLNYFAPIVLLRGGDYLSAFEAVQLHALAMLFVELHEHGIFVVGAFWGLWLLPLGLLVYRSGYFPRVLGVCLIVGCIAYLLDFLSFFLFPSSRGVVVPIVNTAAIIGEFPFILWLLIMGAKVRRPDAPVPMAA